MQLSKDQNLISQLENVNSVILQYENWMTQLTILSGNYPEGISTILKESIWNCGESLIQLREEKIRLLKSKIASLP